MNVARGGPTDLTILKYLKVGVLGDPDDSNKSIDFDQLDGTVIIGRSTPTEPSLADHGDLLNDVSIGGMVSGHLTLRRDLVGTLIVESNANCRIDIEGDLAGELTVEGDLIDTILVRDQLSGALTIDDDCSGTAEIRGSLTGTLAMDGLPASGVIEADAVGATGEINITDAGTGAGNGVKGTITIGDDMDGTIDVTGNWHEGSLEIVDSVAGSGLIRVSDHLRGGTGTAPTWYVGGNMDGTMQIGMNLRSSTSAGDDQPVIAVGGAVGGLIRIDWSLKDGVGTHEEIVVDGGLSTGGAIAVDYDGWDDGHTGRTGAEIKLDATTYDENNPSARVYEIQTCRGDLNNDGEVTSADVDLWDVYWDPNSGFDDDQYRDDYPGLAGSLWYHGNLDCDPNFTATDGDEIDDWSDDDCCLREPACNPPTIPEVQCPEWQQ